MIKVKKPYSGNRKMHPEVYSKYASHASIAEPNDPVYLDTQRMFKVIKTDNKMPTLLLLLSSQGCEYGAQ